MDQITILISTLSHRAAIIRYSGSPAPVLASSLLGPKASRRPSRWTLLLLENTFTATAGETPAVPVKSLPVFSRGTTKGRLILYRSTQCSELVERIPAT